MWHSPQAENNCFHGLIRTDRLTREELQQYKPEVPAFNTSKERVQLVVLLDQYVQSVPRTGCTPIPDSISVLCSSSPLFNKDLFPALTLETLKELCLPETFERFSGRISIKASQAQVLFLQPEHLEFIVSHGE